MSSGVKSALPLSSQNRDSTPTPEDVIGFCDRRLARYKWPKRVFFKRDYPRTTLGKVRKTVLKKACGEIGIMTQKIPIDVPPIHDDGLKAFEGIPPIQ
jgi:hypothetical protein